MVTGSLWGRGENRGRERGQRAGGICLMIRGNQPPEDQVTPRETRRNKRGSPASVPEHEEWRSGRATAAAAH